MFAKERERKIRDLDQVKSFKDEEGKVLLQEIDIKDKCNKYTNYLMKDMRFYWTLIG